MEQKQATGGEHHGLTYNVMEIVTALVACLIGAVVMYDTYKIGAGWAPDGPEAGYFPFRIGAILVISGVYVFFRTLFSKKKNQKVFVAWGPFQQVLRVFVPTVIYITLTMFIGIYVASALFIGSFMRMVGQFSWTKSILVSIGTCLMLFWMFEIQFMVPLPKGPLEALFGY